MKRILKIFLLLIFISIQQSCNKSWLRPDPLSILTPETVYKDEAGFQSLLVTLRKNLKKEMYGNRNAWAQEEAYSDLAIPFFQIDFGKLTPNTSKTWGNILNLFTTSYGCIKDANVLISRIDDIKWSSEQNKNAVLAEAYWHRSYWYYRLVNSYGDVPWIGNEVQNAKLDFATYSRWTILDKLQRDMEFAVKWLPESAPIGAISKGAGNMMLTKIALANANFDEAIKAASEVIDGPYALMTQRFGADANNPNLNVIWDLHRPYNFNIPQNTETILATVDRYEAPPDAKSAGTFTMRLYNCAFYNSVVKDSQGKHGTVDSGGQYDTLGRGNCDVRLTPFYQYDIWGTNNDTWQSTPDLRRSDNNWIDLDEIYYNNPASVDYMKPINPKWFATLFDTLQGGYAMPIYITYVKQENPTARPNGGNADWYIFRLAESYLLRAEAYFYKGQLGLAANDINMVRDRAHALPISADQVTIDFIFAERARELFAESPRHSELIRASYIMAKLNMHGYTLNNFSQKNYYYDLVMKNNIFYSQDITFQGNKISLKPFNALWPIKSEVITANTMGVINQNIGYDGSDKNIPPIEAPIQ